MDRSHRKGRFYSIEIPIGKIDKIVVVEFCVIIGIQHEIVHITAGIAVTNGLGIYFMDRRYFKGLK